MKKYLMTVIAVVATASFTSCSNEMDMFDPISSDMATINLNVTNDNVMNTRAVGNVADPSSWYVTVGTNSSQIQVSGLSGKKYEAGTYNITVSNYTNEAAAITVNDAYYEGSVSQKLEKGSNSVTVPCGKAKNCRVKADLAGLADFALITDAKLTVSQASVDARELTNNTTGYFYAGDGKTISYQLDYKYNTTQMTALTGSISNPVPATEYQVKVVTNSNGTITLTVTYDTEFTTVTAETITIDAATGKKATN